LHQCQGFPAQLYETGEDKTDEKLEPVMIGNWYFCRGEQEANVAQ
jgi:hypothetical protein